MKKYLEKRTRYLYTHNTEGYYIQHAGANKDGLTLADGGGGR